MIIVDYYENSYGSGDYFYLKVNGEPVSTGHSLNGFDFSRLFESLGKLPPDRIVFVRHDLTDEEMDEME